MNLYRLKLYITGQTPRSHSAIHNLKRLIDERIPHNCELDIIDVLKNPQMAEDDKIMATPALVKEQPLPQRRISGDLSDTEKVMLGLEITPHEAVGSGGRL
jgi:circadian clock protein KaiB